MTITVGTKAYDIDASIDVNQNQYTGPNHTASVNDLLTLRRSKSAASDTSPGFAKAFAKYRRTLTVGGKTYDAICEASFSYPVGAAKADVDSLRSDLGTLLSGTAGDNLVYKADINQ